MMINENISKAIHSLDMIDENFTKAIHSLDFACGDLQKANSKASAMESLLLLDVIEMVAKAKQRIEAIQSARNIT